MGRLLISLTLIVAAGCGGGGSSYTDKAMSEFRAGNSFDFREKKARPSAKEVAHVEKMLKNVSAGTKADFVQALHIVLNPNRDQLEAVRDGLAKSNHFRAIYVRVFGAPDSLSTKDPNLNIWTHNCTDGKITVKGRFKTNDPDLMLINPSKYK